MHSSVPRGTEGEQNTGRTETLVQEKQLKMHSASINSLFNLFNLLVHDISDKKREIVFTLNTCLT